MDKFSYEGFKIFKAALINIFMTPMHQRTVCNVEGVIRRELSPAALSSTELCKSILNSCFGLQAAKINE